MPFYLKPSDVLSQVAGLRSVLIVPCRFCPAASMAVAGGEPYLDVFRRGLKTGAYETYIRDLKRRLEDAGIRAAVFDSRLPHNFVTCMWTARRRRKLAKRAAAFDGIVVLGCEAAVETARDSLRDAPCRVVQGMEVNGGVMNVVTTFGFPLKVSLRVRAVTPYALVGGHGRGDVTVGPDPTRVALTQ